MSRRRDALYAGAAGRATLTQAAALGAGHAIQPKLDGCYCVATTDSSGRVAHLVSRAGKKFPAAIASELRGVIWAPDSIIIGELEAWTEAANRIAAGRGYRMLHLFDALRIGGRDVSPLPYRGRRDALLRAESAIICDDRDRPWLEDEHGVAHDLTSGRFVRPVPRSWRRIRVTPQLPARMADQAWAEWVEPGHEAIEGLVVVALESRLGGRGSKRKVKRAETIDATVIGVGARSASVAWAGGTFSVSAGGLALAVGQVVEVVHEGFHESVVTPRFARIARRRRDLDGGRHEREALSARQHLVRGTIGW